jgi:hypothetical protein
VAAAVSRPPPHSTHATGSNPPSSFKRSIIPAMRVAHRGICASPDAIFGSHRMPGEVSGCGQGRVRHEIVDGAVDLGNAQLDTS